PGLVELRLLAEGAVAERGAGRKRPAGALATWKRVVGDEVLGLAHHGAARMLGVSVGAVTAVAPGQHVAAAVADLQRMRRPADVARTATAAENDTTVGGG